MRAPATLAAPDSSLRPMPDITPSAAAGIVRDAITALSERLTGDYGELVPDASLS